jgi:hypothetical protein
MLRKGLGFYTDLDRKEIYRHFLTVQGYRNSVAKRIRAYRNDYCPRNEKRLSKALCLLDRYRDRVFHLCLKHELRATMPTPEQHQANIDTMVRAVLGNIHYRQFLKETIKNAKKRKVRKGRRQADLHGSV